MYNFLTIGYDCSPASALRNLNLRDFALPFDWIVSNINSIEKCFNDDFNKFHTNLKFNLNKTRLIDEYGFEFPHDYPLTNTDIRSDDIGEGVYGPVKNKFIINDWSSYYDIIKEKYNRRIIRFKSIVSDPKPIIVLCRYNNIEHVIKLQELFIKYYKKENMFFINSSTHKFRTNKIINIYTEKNGIWNQECIWKEYIDLLVRQFNLKS